MLIDLLSTVDSALLGFHPAPDKVVMRELSQGIGKPVAAGELVTVHFVVNSADGKELANSEKRGLSYTFEFGKSREPFWTEALTGMRPGGIRFVLLPPEKAFGKDGAAPVVAGGETLHLVVRLLRAESKKGS